MHLRLAPVAGRVGELHRVAPSRHRRQQSSAAMENDPEGLKEVFCEGGTIGESSMYPTNLNFDTVYRDRQNGVAVC